MRVEKGTKAVISANSSVYAIVGAWALLYPQGVLGWAKTAHPSIDVDDPSLWWVPRLIGGFFVAFALSIALFALLR